MGNIQPIAERGILSSFPGHDPCDTFTIADQVIKPDVKGIKKTNPPRTEIQAL
jgi:hypothetical protein